MEPSKELEQMLNEAKYYADYALVYQTRKTLEDAIFYSRRKNLELEESRIAEIMISAYGNAIKVIRESMESVDLSIHPLFGAYGSKKIIEYESAISGLKGEKQAA